ncbi:hypothetical protein AHiyo8_10870 [Arthrobacter sp. Hiyo8]|nr:hypothetical protein AHiyo8_10870 [Arthrobacter sp. Hiyo8]
MHARHGGWGRPGFRLLVRFRIGRLFVSCVAVRTFVVDVTRTWMRSRNAAAQKQRQRVVTVFVKSQPLSATRAQHVKEPIGFLRGGGGSRACGGPGIGLKVKGPVGDGREPPRRYGPIKGFQFAELLAQRLAFWMDLRAGWNVHIAGGSSPMLSRLPGLVSKRATTVHVPSVRRQESHSTLEESIPWAVSRCATISPRLAGSSPNAAR